MNSPNNQESGSIIENMNVNEQKTKLSNLEKNII